MKLKKVLALALAATMTFSLVGCGGSTDTAAEAPAEETTEEAPAEEAAEEAPAAEASGDTIKVGFAQVGHESDWRAANTQNYQDVFSAENGFELTFVDCDNDNAAQLEAVRSFIQQEMDYICIAPIETAGWDTVLQEAQDAGIPAGGTGHSSSGSR